MSCTCCCTKTLSLCNVSVCGDIDFGIEAQKDGVHKLELEFLGVTFFKEQTFAFGERIKFSASGLNESYCYTGKMFDPDGKQILIRKNEIDYDCFSFETSLTFEIAEIESETSS
jgi:hypothetical protein